MKSRDPALTVCVLRALGAAITALEYEYQAGAPGQYTREEEQNLAKADAWWRAQCRKRGWDNIHKKEKEAP